MQTANHHNVHWRSNAKHPMLCVLCALCALCVSSTSCRRDLWVYTDDIRQVELFTDWSEAHETPGGMTWWFINEDGSGQNRSGTTAEVSHTWLNLPRGTFSGIVFDYSPSEYSHQEFTGMDHPDKALMRLLPSADQPAYNEVLYGDSAVAPFMKGVERNSATGAYIVSAEPELINIDTIHNVVIVTGSEGDLILWDERDDYEATLIKQTLNAQPKPIVWSLKVKVQVRGIDNMHAVRGSVSGMADGCWLSNLRHTSSSCLQRIDSWTAHRENDSIGYITSEINVIGLPEPDMPSSRSITFDKRLRLNLQFLLRDQKSLVNYHYNFDDEAIIINDTELVVSIDLPIDFPGIPDLPYVDSSDDAGFDADVTPWENGGNAEATM